MCKDVEKLLKDYQDNCDEVNERTEEFLEGFFGRIRSLYVENVEVDFNTGEVFITYWNYEYDTLKVPLNYFCRKDPLRAGVEYREKLDLENEENKLKEIKEEKKRKEQEEIKLYLELSKKYNRCNCSACLGLSPLPHEIESNSCPELTSKLHEEWVEELNYGPHKTANQEF